MLNPIISSRGFTYLPSCSLGTGVNKPTLRLHGSRLVMLCRNGLLSFFSARVCSCMMSFCVASVCFAPGLSSSHTCMKVWVPWSICMRGPVALFLSSQGFFKGQNSKLYRCPPRSHGPVCLATSLSTLNFTVSKHEAKRGNSACVSLLPLF